MPDGTPNAPAAVDARLAEARSVFGATDDLAAVFDRVVAEFGIKPEDIKAPDVEIVTTHNLESLCTVQSPVEVRGFVLEHSGHTGPLMILSDKTEFTESDEFPDYIGYDRFTAWHGTLGQIIVTYSVPDDGEEGASSDLVRFCRKMKKGALVTFAMMRTRKKYKVFRPIPAQRTVI